MTRTRLLILGGSTFLFFFFVCFSYLVHKGVFVQTDFNTTVVLQNHVSRRVDTPFSWLSVIGSFEPMVILLLVILILRRKVIGGIMAFGAFFFLHLFEIYGKTFVNHHPPPEFMLRTQRLIQFPQFHVSETYSYPSGHAGRALFLTVLIGGFIWASKKPSIGLKIGLTLVLVGYDVIMLVSRVYLGEHWTTDIIGGSILGTSLALVSLFFFVHGSASSKSPSKEVAK